MAGTVVITDQTHVRDALRVFGEQAGKALEVGSDVGTRLETLMKALVPGEYLDD